METHKKNVSGGPKPAVAFRNQEAARLNIRTKIDLLRSLCGQLGRGGPATEEEINVRLTVLPALPRSLRQFNAWSTSGLIEKCGTQKFGSDDWPEMLRNASQTLRGLPDLRREVEMVLQAVILLPTAAKRPSVTAERTSALRERLKLAMLMKEICEREVKTTLREAVGLRAMVQQLEAKLQSLTKETERIVKERDSALAALGLAKTFRAEIIPFEAKGSTKK